MMPPSYEFSLSQLDTFLRNGLLRYSGTSNIDNGPEDRSNTSFLLPFIKKRIFHDKFVLESVLKSSSYYNIEKFIPI